MWSEAPAWLAAWRTHVAAACVRQQPCATPATLTPYNTTTAANTVYRYKGANTLTHPAANLEQALLLGRERLAYPAAATAMQLRMNSSHATIRAPALCALCLPRHPAAPRLAMLQQQRRFTAAAPQRALALAQHTGKLLAHKAHHSMPMLTHTQRSGYSRLAGYCQPDMPPQTAPTHLS